MGAASTKVAPPKRFKWTKRIAIFLFFYAIIGFFVVPAVIKSEMLKRLPALTQREVAVKQVRFNPFALSLTIRGFSLKEPEGEIFSSFDEFYINFQPWASLFRRSWVFSEISLSGPYAQAIYREDGTFNFANLLTGPASQSSPPANPGPPPRVIVYNLSITNGGLALADLKRKDPFHTEFLPINLNLTNLTTIRDKNSPYKFIARTDSGETFAWSGTITLNPLRSSGLFRLGGLKLGKYSTYGHDFARFDIVDGVVDVASDYNYDSSTNALDLTLSQAAVHLNNLQLKAPDTGEMVVSVPSFSITGTDASVANRTARIGLINSSGGSLLVRQNHDGTINLLSLLNPLTPSGPQQSSKLTGESSTERTAPWSVKIDEISIDDYTIKAEDKKPPQPASFNIDKLSVDLKGVSNASNAPVSASVVLRFQESGTVAVNGTATLMPPSADFQLALTNIDLRSIGPYAAEQVKLAITKGALNLNGRARYAPPEPGAPLMSFAGNLDVTNFDAIDDVLFKDFAKLTLLTVDGIQASMEPGKLRADVNSVGVDGLTTSVLVGPDGRINLQTILRNQLATTNKQSAPTESKITPATIPATVSSTPAIATELEVATLALKKVSFLYGDQSLRPHCNFGVEELSGTIKGLSSRKNTTAIVDLKGRVDDRSPFSVVGRINPLAKPPFADITVLFTNTELTAFTPYAEKYAGRPLQKGKLSFAVHYHVETNTLKAENGIFVDQLALGPKNNSTNATKLPVKLAVALLKDIHGRITLDIPVQGRMDDPKFRVGPIIWHVVVNLLEKAATSPFSLLGAMFGGGDEMRFVAFEPGHYEVPESEMKKLETLAKALHERPALTVEINGAVDPIADRLPLAEMKLDQQIKSLWVKEQTDSGKPAVALDEVVLEPKQRERLLKKIHKATFGRYKPTEISPTNQSAAAIAQLKAARVLAAIAEEQSHAHGASMLLAQPIPVAPAPKTAKATATTPNAKPAKLKTRYELELEDMEDQLVQKTQITEDDLRELMQQRAKHVQAALLKTENVTADRLFITAPKPVSPNSKGEDRANLTLD